VQSFQSISLVDADSTDTSC